MSNMYKPSLVTCGVVFDEAAHRYTLHGRRLIGITGLIHDVLKLGVYPDASHYVQNVLIPKAGDYGSAVHKAIEMYEELGIRQTSFAHSEPMRFGPGFWNVGQELDNYLRNRQGYISLASEYTVTDGMKWASNIDNVWMRQSDGVIVLADTKTNNMDYYPGKEQGLKEYLSWQLSIYALLFERQNPGLKVGMLVCNWLRKDKAELWVIERKSDTMVEALLMADWAEENGRIRYDHPCPEMLVSDIAAPKSDMNKVLGRAAVDSIYRIQSELARYKELSERMKALVKEAMEKAGVKSWDSDLFRVTVKAAGQSSTFDSSRFKKEHPELYSQYTSQKERPSSLVITLRSATEPGKAS